VVHDQRADQPHRIVDRRHHIAILAQDRQKVGYHEFQPIDLAVLQCGGGRRRVGDYYPLDAVYDHVLAAREP
jgi:hypothetical protein